MINFDDIYGYDMLVDNICKKHKTKNIVKHVLSVAIYLHQWEYQNSVKNKSNRDAKNRAENAIETVRFILEMKGEKQLSTDIYNALIDTKRTEEEILDIPAIDNNLTKRQVLVNVKKTMKEVFLRIKTISKYQYNKEYAVYLESAFIEYCDDEDNKLKEPHDVFKDN